MTFHDHIYIYDYIYMYIVKKTDNVPSWLLPICQWHHGNSCTWAHDVQCVMSQFKPVLYIIIFIHFPGR